MDDGHGARSNVVNQLTENSAIGQGLPQIFWQGNLQLRLQSLQHRQSIKDVFILVGIKESQKHRQLTVVSSSCYSETSDDIKVVIKNTHKEQQRRNYRHKLLSNILVGFHTTFFA